MRGAFFRMHLAIFLWGFTAILGKLILLDEGMLVWYRMLISATAMGIYLFYRKQMIAVSWPMLLRLSGIGLVITLHWITFYGAIKASNVSVAIASFSSVALFTALLEPLIRKKKFNVRELLLGSGVIGGIYIIFSVQHFYANGILLSLSSAFLAALFTILNKSMSEKVSPETMCFYELSTGFILLSFLLPLWFSINESSFAVPTVNDSIYLLVLGIVCTTFAFTISLQALQKLDAFTMNLSVNLEPVYSIVLAMLFFNEHELLGLKFYIGTLLILATVLLHGWLTRLRENRQKKQV